MKKFRNLKRMKANNRYISDITDGIIYQKFISSISDTNINDNFTFLINTDGLSICNKSNLTIWPFYLVLNEIPQDIRYCSENIIIAGLSVAIKKPNFDIFLSPIIEELIEIQHGVYVSNDSKSVDLVYFHVLHAVLDKPARADLLNVKLCTGDYGCIKCLQSGKNLKLRKGSLLLAF